MSAPRIAITGGAGVMGRELARLLPGAIPLTHENCDVRSWGGLARALHAASPDIVIHAAALTDHQHPNAAEVIETNILGTANVARWCRATGTRLVYLSTHYVYGPNAPVGGFQEWAELTPIGAYAMSKLAGEMWVDDVPGALVIRGSWYTAEKLRAWARDGALVDAWCNREPVAVAARKIVALATSDVAGTVNIGGARRSFAEIVARELDDVFETRTRREFDATGAAPYLFPRDTTVNTGKFESLAPTFGYGGEAR